MGEDAQITIFITHPHHMMSNCMRPKSIRLRLSESAQESAAFGSALTYVRRTSPLLDRYVELGGISRRVVVSGNLCDFGFSARNPQLWWLYYCVVMTL